MSEENSHAEIFKIETTGDENKLSLDGQDLGPRRAGPFIVGLVDFIAGQGGLEVPGFVQLVRYWATEIIELDFEFFLYGSSGSTKWRTHVFAHRRSSTISSVIGEEEVTKAVMQAEQGFAKGVDQQTWKIFTTGTKEERERFQNEVQERLVAVREDHK